VRHTGSSYRRWKLAFLSLLIINIIVILAISWGIFSLLKTPPDEDERLIRSPIDDTKPLFHVQTTKEQLTTFINDYLTADDDSFTLLLHDYIELDGKMDIYGLHIDYSMHFTPEVVDGGNLRLQQHSFSFGLFQVPNSLALQFLDNLDIFPEWVYIQPQNETIYVDLQQLTIANTTKIKLQTFDLERNNIVFALVHE